MHIISTIHRSEGINIHGKTNHRIAVRGVILRGREILMVYSSNAGDYKFPGGGVEPGEAHEHALRRELLEECGATLANVDEELGAIIEYDSAKGRNYEVFKMTSHYYSCQIQDGFAEQKLEGYEADLGFQPLWVDIDHAIAQNESLLKDAKPIEWLQRETFMLEYISSHLLPHN
jgi:8-oxo-dGTP pyrophosphatase MutT (NUDIX family)